MIIKRSSLKEGQIPTSAEDWFNILKTVEITARSPYTNKDIRLLWCQGIIVLISGMLYLISLLRRISMSPSPSRSTSFQHQNSKTVTTNTTRRSRVWCIQKDNDGYWRPNVHVAIPMITITHAATQSAGIGLIVITGAPQDKIPCIVALNLIACSTLYFAGWTKIWAVLYALPSSIFRLRRRDVLGSTAMITKRRILSPKRFNLLILMGYLIGLCPLPSLIYTVYDIQAILKELSNFRRTVSEIIESYHHYYYYDSSTNSRSMTTSTHLSKILILSLQAQQEGVNLSLKQHQALNKLRSFSGIWLCVSFLALIIFLGGSFALFLALTRQLEILIKIQKQRELLINRRRTSSFFNDSQIDHHHHPKIVHPLRYKPLLELHQNQHQTWFKKLQSWIPKINPQTDEEEDPLDTTTRLKDHHPPHPPEFHLQDPSDLILITDHQLHSSTTTTDHPHHQLHHQSKKPSSLIIPSVLEDIKKLDLQSRKRIKKLNDYRVRFAWQTVFCTLIATSFIVLNVFVVFNVFDAPRSITLSQLLRTIEQWAAWSWGGGPGAILGLLACVIAFTRNPILPQEPERGPPSKLKILNDFQGEDRLEEETDHISGSGGDHPIDDSRRRRREEEEEAPLTMEKVHLHTNGRRGGDESTRMTTNSSIITNTTTTTGWLKNKFIHPNEIGKSSSSSSRSNSSRSPGRPRTISEVNHHHHHRPWSPFEIMSLDSSNLVTLTSLKPHSFSSRLNQTLTTTSSSNSNSSSASKVQRPMMAYHYPTRNFSSTPLKEDDDDQDSRRTTYKSTKMRELEEEEEDHLENRSLGQHFQAIQQLREKSTLKK